MKKFLSVALFCLMYSFFSFTTIFALEPISLDTEVIKELKMELDSLDIPLETQDFLIQKLEKGETWDCMNPEKIAEVPKDYLVPTLKDPVKRYVFEDGSVIENSILVSNTINPLIPMPIYYDNVKISGKNGLVGGGFYADYCIDGNSNDRISAVRDSYINVVGGSYSNKELSIVRSAEDTSRKKPAEAILTADISYLGDIGAAETFHFKMFVGNDQMMSGFLGKISASDLY